VVFAERVNVFVGTLSPKRGRSIFAATEPFVGDRHLDDYGDGTIDAPPFPRIVPILGP